MNWKSRLVAGAVSAALLAASTVAVAPSAFAIAEYPGTGSGVISPTDAVPSLTAIARIGKRTERQFVKTTRLCVQMRTAEPGSASAARAAKQATDSMVLASAMYSTLLETLPSGIVDTPREEKLKVKADTAVRLVGAARTTAMNACGE